MEYLSTISLWQWGGLFFGLLYIGFAAKHYQHCWAYGLLSAICICVVDFTETRLYMDGVLHILYAGLSILGLYLCLQGQSKQKIMKISRLSKSGYMSYITLSVIIAIGTGFLLSQQTNANFPYLDGFASTLAVFSTFLVIYRVLDVWFFWLIINIISIYLYWMTDAPALAFLFTIYLASNLYKWKIWRREWKSEKI